MKLMAVSFSQIDASLFFFCGGRDSNPGLCIYYPLFLPTELSSRGQYTLILF